MAGRSAEWFEQWLGRQEVYSSQPYEQLAHVLQNNGDVGKATEILYAGKERERRASSGARYVWMTTLKLVVGYGYHIERALYWALGFVFVGWLVLLATKQTRKYDVPIGITYSFDMLLPLLALRKKHYDIDLDDLPRCYFYVHKVVGYILASFLVVGLSGLTK